MHLLKSHEQMSNMAAPRIGWYWYGMPNCTMHDMSATYSYGDIVGSARKLGTEKQGGSCVSSVIICRRDEGNDSGHGQEELIAESFSVEDSFGYIRIKFNPLGLVWNSN